MSKIPLAPPLAKKYLTEAEEAFLEGIIQTHTNDSTQNSQHKQRDSFWFDDAPFTPKSAPIHDSSSCTFLATQQLLETLPIECLIVPITSIEALFHLPVLHPTYGTLRFQLAKTLLKQYRKRNMIRLDGFGGETFSFLFYCMEHPHSIENMIEDIFSSIIEQRLHYIAMDGSKELLVDHISVWNNFIENWMMHNSWVMEQMIFVVKEQKTMNVLNDMLSKLALRERQQRELPKLLPALMKTHRGPVACSNWVIPSRLMAGAYPGDKVKNLHIETVSQVMESGVTTFVCLQTKNELNRFTKYKETVLSLAKPGQRYSFIHFPIGDQSVAPDREVKRIVIDLARRLCYSDETIYVHCWGGHGRTGTIIALLIGFLYSIDSEEALERTGEYHRMRTRARSRSPQSRCQFDQVRRLLSETSFKIQPYM